MAETGRGEEGGEPIITQPRTRLHHKTFLPFPAAPSQITQFHENFACRPGASALLLCTFFVFIIFFLRRIE
jgi:hypothetical protein